MSVPGTEYTLSYVRLPSQSDVPRYSGGEEQAKELTQYFDMRYLIKGTGEFLPLVLISKRKPTIAS